MIKKNLYPKDPFDGKYHLLINKRESVRLKNCDNSKALIEYLNDIEDIYEYIDEFNLNKNHKM